MRGRTLYYDPPEPHDRHASRTRRFILSLSGFFCLLFMSLRFTSPLFAAPNDAHLETPFTERRSSIPPKGGTLKVNTDTPQYHWKLWEHGCSFFVRYAHQTTVLQKAMDFNGCDAVTQTEYHLLPHNVLVVDWALERGGYLVFIHPIHKDGRAQLSTLAVHYQGTDESPFLIDVQGQDIHIETDRTHLTVTLSPKAPPALTQYRFLSQ